MLSSVLRIALIVLLALTFGACAAVAGIFKAGIWVGAIIVIVIVLIVFLLFRGRGGE